jgi:hypothetical protein
MYINDKCSDRLDTMLLTTDTKALIHVADIFQEKWTGLEIKSVKVLGK